MTSPNKALRLHCLSEVTIRKLKSDCSTTDYLHMFWFSVCCRFGPEVTNWALIGLRREKNRTRTSGLDANNTNHTID